MDAKTRRLLLEHRKVLKAELKSTKRKKQLVDIEGRQVAKELDRLRKLIDEETKNTLKIVDGGHKLPERIK